jgi:hypothetical protein
MIIKLEEEYPLSSPDYDPAFFNHCLTTFYDQDSNEIIENKCSVQDVIPNLFRSSATLSIPSTSATLPSMRS